MIKTAIVFVALAFASVSAAYAAQDNSNGPVSSSLQQIRRENDELRNAVNADRAEIKSLKQQMASNQTTPAAPQVDQRKAARIAAADAQCPTFHTLSERDRKTLTDKYVAMDDRQFADAMKNCANPNWQQKAYYDEKLQLTQTEQEVAPPVVDESADEQPEQVQYRVGPRGYPPANPALLRMLAERDQQMLGPPEAGYQGYKGERRGHMPVPAGCTENPVHDPVTRHTYVRVTCR